MIPSASPTSDLVEHVRVIIGHSLGRPVTEITPTARLMHDLHCESIDLLDILFSLEQAFDIEITRGALEAAARGDMSEEEFAPNGKISAPGLARLRELLPEVADQIGDGLRPREVMTLFTATTFARIVAGAKAAS